jgi:hypothetical protein
MGLVSLVSKATAGAVAGVGLIMALPVLGTVGAITATGMIIGSTGCCIAGAIDHFSE